MSTSEDFERQIAELKSKLEMLEKIIEVKVYVAERNSCVIVNLHPPIHAREIALLKNALHGRIVKHLELTGSVQLICTNPGAQIYLGELVDDD